MIRDIKVVFGVLVCALFVGGALIKAEPAYVDQAQYYRADPENRPRALSKTINTKKTASKKTTTKKSHAKKTKEQERKPKKVVTEVQEEQLIIEQPVPDIQPAQDTGIPADAVLVDEIKAVVYAPEGTKIITAKETKTRSLDGRVRTLDDLIYEQLMLLDAQKFKMLPDEEMIERHLAAVQRENNLSLDDLKIIFKQAGYTFEEGREQFGMISVINQLLDFKIRSRLIVPEKDVVAYYNAHPQEVDARYEVEHAVIPYDDSMTKDEQQEMLNGMVGTKKFEKVVTWESPFWIEEGELAEDKKYITELAVGQTSLAHPASMGFEFFRLKNKQERRVRSLEDRYREISEFLRKPRYDQLLTEYKDQLKASSAVLYLD